MTKLILVTQRVAFFVMLIVTPINPAHAIEGAPQTISEPIPSELRAPFARYLRELGATDTDTEKMLVGTSGGFFPDIDGTLRMFRVETSGTCTKDNDQCLTIIGKIDNGELIAQATFLAGNRMNAADVLTNFFGTRSPAVRFYSKEIIMSVTRTAKGLLVVASPQSAPPM